MAQTLEMQKIDYPHYFVDPEGLPVTELVKKVGDHLTIELKGPDRRLIGRYEHDGRAVLDDNRPHWHRIPDPPTMQRFQAKRLPEQPALAVLVSGVSDAATLQRHGMPTGTWTRFSTMNVPYGASPEEALKQNVLGGVLAEDDKIQPLGCVYVAETGCCVHFYKLVPFDFLRIISHVPPDVRQAILKRYFADNGYHSARAIELAPAMVQLMAREFEALRPD